MIIIRRSWRRIAMAKCPKCGVDVAKPTKTWRLAPKGKKAITIGLYKCSGCGAFFRAAQK
jgi:DNA-directed RNA polymerase subunit RPC12/RpoP